MSIILKLLHLTVSTSLITPLSTCALVGTRRNPPAWPNIPGELGILFNNLDSSDIAGCLLQTAGILALAEDLAYKPMPVIADNIVTFGSETALPILHSKRLYDTLDSLIKEGPINIVYELITLLAQHQIQFPPKYLPLLLDSAIKNPLLANLIAKLPGSRHHWLIRLNPAWQSLQLLNTEITRQDTNLLEEGNKQERIAAYKNLRSTDPGQARLWLTDTLPQMAAKERQEFVTILWNGLSKADTELLTKLLQDRSKLVKQLASKMLSCLPESEFAQQIGSYLGSMVQLKQHRLKTKLLIEPPDSFVNAWSYTTIEAQPPTGEGARAFWLRQIVSLTYLDWWEQNLNMAPDTILDLCNKSDWTESLMWGLFQATLTQRNSNWALAFFKAKSIKPALDKASLINIADSNAVEGFLTEQLANCSNLSKLLKILQQAMLLSNWSEAFSLSIIENLQPHSDSLNTYRNVTLHLHPNCLKLAASLVDTDTVNDYSNTFLQTLNLRLLIHQEILTQ